MSAHENQNSQRRVDRDRPRARASVARTYAPTSTDGGSPSDERAGKVDDYFTVESLAQYLGLKPSSGRVTLRESAWHEAGHATVAVALRVPLRVVRIGTEHFAYGGTVETIGGLVDFAPPGPIFVKAFGATKPETLAQRVLDRRLENMIAVGLAGPLASEIRAGVCRGYELDLCGASKLAIERCRGRHDRALVLLLGAHYRASTLLSRHQAAWGRIARALQKRRSLDGESVHKLFRATAALKAL
jgi:hypothetical protein